MFSALHMSIYTAAVEGPLMILSREFVDIHSRAHWVCERAVVIAYEMCPIRARTRHEKIYRWMNVKHSNIFCSLSSSHIIIIQISFTYSDKPAQKKTEIIFKWDNVFSRFIFWEQWNYIESCHQKRTEEEFRAFLVRILRLMLRLDGVRPIGWNILLVFIRQNILICENDSWIHNKSGRRLASHIRNRLPRSMMYKNVFKPQLNDGLSIKWDQRRTIKENKVKQPRHRRAVANEQVRLHWKGKRCVYYTLFFLYYIFLLFEMEGLAAARGRVKPLSCATVRNRFWVVGFGLLAFVGEKSIFYNYSSVSAVGRVFMQSDLSIQHTRRWVVEKSLFWDSSSFSPHL